MTQHSHKNDGDHANTRAGSDARDRMWARLIAQRPDLADLVIDLPATRNVRMTRTYWLVFAASMGLAAGMGYIDYMVGISLWWLPPAMTFAVLVALGVAEIISAHARTSPSTSRPLVRRFAIAKSKGKTKKP